MFARGDDVLCWQGHPELPGRAMLAKILPHVQDRVSDADRAAAKSHFRSDTDALVFVAMARAFLRGGTVRGDDDDEKLDDDASSSTTSDVAASETRARLEAHFAAACAIYEAAPSPGAVVLLLPRARDRRRSHRRLPTTRRRLRALIGYARSPRTRSPRRRRRPRARSGSSRTRSARSPRSTARPRGRTPSWASRPRGWWSSRTRCGGGTRAWRRIWRSSRGSSEACARWRRWRRSWTITRTRRGEEERLRKPPPPARRGGVCVLGGPRSGERIRGREGGNEGANGGADRLEVPAVLRQALLGHHITGPARAARGARQASCA